MKLYRSVQAANTRGRPRSAFGAISQEEVPLGMHRVRPRRLRATM